MSCVGIIFSNIHDKNIPELTRKRTMASVPFGCRYRLIDFALSNMVNSDITTINVITHYNYHSLMDHIGTGKDWDLARRSGGIKILPPFISAFANNVNELYTTRLEALMSINHCIANIQEDYVVMSDCDVICNIDLRDMIAKHAASGADLTFAIKKVKLHPSTAKNEVVIKSDADGKITDFEVSPSATGEDVDVNLNIIVAKTKYLQDAVADAIAHGYKSMTTDILVKNIGRADYRTYRYEGHSAKISSMPDYFAHNMEIISDQSKYDSLFNVEGRPILTKVRNSPPTYYNNGAKAKNSLIADGCVIEGTVENCILFRGVRIGKGAVVKNCILFQDTFVGENANINCVIADKNVVIRDGVTLAGVPTLPFYLDKKRMV